MVALARSRAALGGHGAVAEILVVCHTTSVGKGLRVAGHEISDKGSQVQLGIR